jgi:hypothetical protein
MNPDFEGTSRGVIGVNFSLSLIKQYDMKVYEGVDVQIHIFLTSALVGDE